MGAPKPTLRCVVAFVCIGLVATLLAQTGSAFSSPPATAARTRGPIRIVGDADFTATNGVVGGSGTSSDPYLIADWNINAYDDYAIVVQDTSSFFTIRTVSVTAPPGLCGIYLGNVTNGLLDAVASSQDYGICLVESRRTTVRASVAGSRLIVETSSTVRIENNTIVGDLVILYSDNVTAVSNHVSGTDGLVVSHSVDSLLEANNVSGVQNVGISLYYTNNTTLNGNMVWSGTQAGILLEYAANTTIQGNRLFDVGIVTRAAPRFYFTTLAIPPGNFVNGRPIAFHSNCADVVENGSALGQLIVVSCSRLVATNLTIERVHAGILLAYVSDGLVASNQLRWNRWEAVSIYASSGIQVVGNTLEDNDGGLNLFQTSNSSVYHNNFIRSVASDEEAPGNAWDDGYPSGGNYFGSYDGPDNCSGPSQNICPGADGFGDVPVFIGTDAYDRYPRMVPYGRPALPPSASFSFTPSVPIVGLGVFFDAAGSADPDGTIRSYSWDFGDGTSAQGTSSGTSHVYGYRGNFIVNLTVQDNSGLSGNTSQLVSVTAGPGAAFTISPDPPYIRQTVTFDASSSRTDPSRTIIWYHWAFGDSTFADGMIVTHVYTYPGDAGVDLWINDDGGYSAESFRIITVGYDVGPPVSTATLAGVRGENGWFRSAVTATLRATDEGSGIATFQYRLDGGPWQDYSAPLNFTDGERLLEYFATDRARHVETIHAVPIRVDSVPPDVDRLDPSGTVSSDNVTIAWSATDGGSGIARFEVSVDSGPFASFSTTTSLTLDLPGGSHSVRLRAVDAAGNVAERSTTFQVGPERPESLAGPLLFSGVAAASLGTVAFALYRTKTSKRRSPEETHSQEPKNDGT